MGCFFQKTLCLWKKSLCFQMKLKSNEILAPSFKNVLTFEAMHFGTQTHQITLTNQRRSSTHISKICPVLGESQRSTIFRPLGRGSPTWAASKNAWRESWRGIFAFDRLTLGCISRRGELQSTHFAAASWSKAVDCDDEKPCKGQFGGSSVLQIIYFFRGRP